jgi:hypothetical protein
LIVKRNRKEFVGGPNMTLTLSAGIVSGSITAIVKYQQLKQDPRPWQQKAAIVVGSALLSSASASISLLVAQQANIFVTNLTADFAVELAGFIGFDASSNVIGSLLGASASYAVFDVIRLGATTIREVQQGHSLAQIKYGLGNAAMGIIGEQFGFFLLGIMLDSFTPIPDPVVGTIVNVLRVGTSVVKTASDIEKNIESQRISTEKRLLIAYNKAIEGY